MKKKYPGIVRGSPGKLPLHIAVEMSVCPPLIKVSKLKSFCFQPAAPQKNDYNDLLGQFSDH